MQPRLKSSKKWSPLPKELIQQIQSIFRENFQAHTSGSKIEVDGHIYPEEILIRVGLAPEKGLKQRNWEISVGYRKDKDNVLKLLHLAVDVIGALFEQTFTSETDEDFPRLWQEVDFEGRPVFIQYTTTNSALESEADRLLGLGGTGDDVAQGDWDDLTPEQIKQQLGIDEDELDEAGDEGDVDPDGKKPTTH